MRGETQLYRVFKSRNCLLLRTEQLTTDEATGRRRRLCVSKCGYMICKSSPVTGLEWPRGFQEVKIKVKLSRYRPGVAQRVPGS